MYKLLTLLMLVAGGISAADIQTYYNFSAYQDAVAPGTESLTEGFAGNQVNTPGLTITVCAAASRMTACAPAGSGQFLDDLSAIRNSEFSDTIGHLGDGLSYGVIFTLPNETTAIGFQIDENPSPAGGPGAAFKIGIGGTAVYPFGGVEGPGDPFPGLPNTSYGYTGFVGFVSDTPFDQLAFNSAFADPASFTIDDITFPTPEPATIAIVGLGLVAFMVCASITRTVIDRNRVIYNAESRLIIHWRECDDANFINRHCRVPTKLHGC